MRSRRKELLTDLYISRIDKAYSVLIQIDNAYLADLYIAADRQFNKTILQLTQIWSYKKQVGIIPGTYLTSEDSTKPQ